MASGTVFHDSGEVSASDSGGILLFVTVELQNSN
jgi:hypothetical protein